MPMFNSDEEFEKYVAQQQAELVGDAQVAEESTQPRRQKGGLELWQKALGVVVPAALILVVGVFLFREPANSRPTHHDPWDKILDTAAWVGGREYNANADSLTERLTFRKKRKTSSQSD